jgi:hypothetical protein
MMALLGFYGSVSPAEFDDMDPYLTRAYARKIGQLHQQDVELRVNLAKLVAGMKLDYSAPEVRG